MKFYIVVIVLAVVSVVVVSLIVKKTSSNACGCTKKFTDDYDESEVAVEREG